MTLREKQLKNLAACLPLFVALSFLCFLWTRASALKKAAKEARPLEREEKEKVEARLDALFPERNAALRALPYAPPQADFSLWAGAAILIDQKTGFVLYEKNADEVIPPASMIKLYLIRCALEKVRNGEAALERIIPLDSRSWACNAPPESSLMFLGKGHIVTLEELLCGLSVASGNDAASAVAWGLFGGMDGFLAEANSLVKALGMKKTAIVEPSGYSEDNMTTPREMAAFCRLYVRDYPEALERFHSMERFVYPKEKNLPPEQRNRAPQDFSKGIPEEIWTPFDFKNTNSLLGVLPGCDGIKTGHIRESGYNLALTTERGGERYISVTMKGPGKSMKEGDQKRAADGTALHEWAYKNFSSFGADALGQTEWIVPLYGSEKMFVRLFLKESARMPVPKGAAVRARIKAPAFLFGAVEAGAAYGSAEILDGERILREIPLVAAENSGAANQFIQRCDEFILRARGLR